MVYEHYEKPAVNRLTSAFQTVDPEEPPPWHEEGEMCVLGCMLIDNECIGPILEIISAGDLWLDAHQIIFRRIECLHQRGAPVNAVTLVDDLRTVGLFEAVRGLDYLTEIVQIVPHAAQATYYAKVVKEKAKARIAIEQATEVIRRARSQQYLADDVLDAATKLIEDARSARPEEEMDINPLPAKMEAPAFRGVLGEIVQRIEQQTEASPESILAQLLVGFGNIVGRRPFFQVNATSHHTNLFVVIVGPTGAGRKGTSWGIARWLLGQCDTEWAKRPDLSGLTTGEGLIRQAKERDGPMIWVESEIGRLLKNGQRDGNSLMEVLKQAWETGTLCVPTRGEPLYVSDAHISLIAHGTYGKLKKRINDELIEDGFANRFMFVHTYRNGIFPEGSDFRALKDSLAPFIRTLEFAKDFAKSDSSLDGGVPYIRDADAKKMWAPLYEQLTESLPGHYGDAVERRAPIICRLAMIYSILDRDVYIRCEHIEAALAFWNYCDATAAHIFGKPKTDKRLARAMALLDGAKEGLVKTEISRRLFNGRAAPGELDALIRDCYATGKYLYKETKTGGAKRHVLIHKRYAQSEQNDAKSALGSQDAPAE
jgi:hypothetical protein